MDSNATLEVPLRVEQRNAAPSSETASEAKSQLNLKAKNEV